MSVRRFWLVVFVLLLGCKSSPSAPPLPGPPGPSTTPPTPPASQNDPAFAVSELRDWYIVKNDLTPGHDELRVVVAAPTEVAFVDMWLDGGPGFRLDKQGDTFIYQGSLAEVAPAEHEILLAADSSTTAFARHTFQRSHPLYVVVSTDWDDPDNPDANLARHDELHAGHPELKITHFVGPYTFTDPSVSADRRAYLASWVQNMRDTHGDEIGVHVHPYCSFVETTSVPCRHQPSIAYSDGDTTGYTVELSSYNQAESLELFTAATAIFEHQGLGTPTSFRAGAWTAEIHTIKALGQAGYVVDTSAANWSRMEEWEGRPGATLYEWNQTNWASINDTSQPYYPNESDILSSAPPHTDVLEVPDNGLLVDYVSGAEMIEIFGKNWPGGALPEPRAYSIGFHPPNFSEKFKERMHMALSHVDQFLASQDRGPAIYVNLSDTVKVWQPPAAR